MKHAVLRIALALAVAGQSGPVFASDGSKSDSNSGDSSGNSSDGSSDSNSNSDGSDRSSDNSGESSNNSGDSSKNSDGSSERSSENSTKNSSDETSDGSGESSKSNTGKTLSIAGAIIVLGASVLGGIALTADSDDGPEKSAELLLEKFMKRHHPALARDIVLAKGPVLDSIARDLGLNGAEARRFFVALENSTEQTVMLESLAGKIDRERAALFAETMCSVVERALGTERMRLAVHHATKRRV